MNNLSRSSVAGAIALAMLSGPAAAYAGQWYHHNHRQSKPITVVPAPSTPAKTATTPKPAPTPAPTSTAAKTASTASSTSSATRLSVFVGNDPSQVSQFQNWLGRHVDEIELHGDHSSWSAMMSCFSWQAGLFRPLGVDIVWSVPLIPQGATLSAAASGAYDAKYKQMAQQFVSQWPYDKQIFLRVGWEFNASWFPWGAIGKAAQYKAAYRHFVAAFRSVAPNRFKFEWTPNVGGSMDPTTAYPGDDVVDVIGMDFYYDTKWLGTDPNKAWNTMVNEKWGLQWQQTFAAQHHKPTAYDEWGVNSDGAGPYIQAAHKWFKDHHVLYQNYWNSNSAFRGDLSNKQYPHAAAAYKSAFGSDPVVGTMTAP